MPQREIKDLAKIDQLGRWIDERFEKHKKDRRAKEDQWLKNMRQEKGIYDPEIEKTLRPDGSRAYPKLTRLKSRGTVSRLMEMMFPQSEKNYSVDPSSVPNLLKDDLNAVLKEAEAEKGGELNDNEIEHAVRTFARQRANNMEREIDDVLQEIQYIDLVREVVKSGTNYGIGVLAGPFVERESVRTWTRDVNDGTYTAVEADRMKPSFEFVRCWDYYPDMSVTNIDKLELEFWRKPVSKAGLIKLKSRSDYLPSQIDRVIMMHGSGNYKEEHWEEQVREKKSDRENVSEITNNKYELIEGCGLLSPDQLAAAGEDISEHDTDKLVFATFASVGGIVIKAIKAPYDRQKSIFHKFIFNNDDMSLLGTGLPEDMRDSQMAICEAARMVLDNASVSCGPQLEIDIDLLLEGQNLDIHAFKTWLKEGGKGAPTNAGNQAVKNIKIESHITELLSIIELFMNFADQETALPPPALGDVGQGGSEALRTSRGASMLLGAAALPIREIVRNFDRFTVSVISSLYDWLMVFREKPTIKGDFTVVPKGSTSLIAKEVRAHQINQLRVTLTEDEKDWLNEEKVVRETISATDLPLDLLETRATVDKKRNARAEAQAEQQEMLKKKVDAEVREKLSKVVKNLTDAQATSSSAAAELAQALLEAINTGDEDADGKSDKGKGSSAS